MLRAPFRHPYARTTTRAIWVFRPVPRHGCIFRAQELCEGRGGCPGLPVPNSFYGLCVRKATLNFRAQELCEGGGGRPGLPVPNSPYGLRGRKAALNSNTTAV